MNIYDIKVEELKDINTVKRIYNRVSIELDTVTDDLYFQDTTNYQETKVKAMYLERLLYKLRLHIYELMKPEFTDGTIDLYRDHDTHFTITEHDKKIPIGVIEYYDTTRPVPGNISYSIEKEYQGHHYALRALRIIGKRLLDTGVTKIFVTASNNKNYPSMKTIEAFGGILRNNKDKEEPGPVPYICDLKKIYSK